MVKPFSVSMSRCERIGIERISHLPYCKARNFSYANIFILLVSEEDQLTFMSPFVRNQQTHENEAERNFCIYSGQFWTKCSLTRKPSIKSASRGFWGKLRQYIAKQYRSPGCSSRIYSRYLRSFKSILILEVLQENDVLDV